MPEKSIYAGFWIRLASYLIDYIILVVLIVLFSALASAAWWYSHTVGRSGSPLDGIEGWLYIVYVPSFWLYRTIFEASKAQGTVGKIVFGLAVTDLNLQRIGYGKANARFWSRILSSWILFAGFIMAAFTKKKQALHDMIAGTVVVKKARIPAATPSVVR